MKAINAAIAVALIAAVVHAEDRFDKTFSRSLTYHGGRVTVENRFGDVKIHTGHGNNVVLRATIRSSDSALGRAINIEMTEAGGGITIKTVMPTITHHGSLSFSIDEDLTVPDEAPLYVTNHFGSIDATGLRAASELVSRQGSIALRDSSGRQRVESTFGSIDVEHAAGDVDATSSNGSITARRIDGKLSATNRFGSIDVKDIGGATHISNGNGNVTVADVRSNLTVETRFGQVRAEHIRGALVVSGANGDVNAADIAGDVRVRSSFGSVFLKGVDGAVDVQNQNGGISVAGLRGGCHPISLRTSFSSIKVAVPPKTGYNFDARTTFGSINAEVPIDAVRRSNDTLTGTINGGGCKMELVTANGGVTITAE
jgi:putative adhesin